jgi:hypothetical protein
MVPVWLTCVVLPGSYLARLYSFKSPRHPQIWMMLVHCCHCVEVLFHHVHMRLMFLFNYDYLVVEINDTKNG